MKETQQMPMRKNIRKNEEYYLSSSFHTACTDLPDPLKTPVSIVYQYREIFKYTSCIGTEL